MLTRLKALAAAAALIACVGPVSAPQAACDEGGPCWVADGHYLAEAPADWDGASPLGVVLYFHGLGGSADQVMQRRRLVRAITGRDAVFVAMHGLDATWRFTGAPATAAASFRDDIAYTGAVLADVARRWPIDRGRVLAAGFSQGGSMVWHLACFRPDAFGITAYAPIAGGFWQPQAEHCPAGPVEMRHIHGTADRIVPLTGREPVPGHRQGDIAAGIALWRAHNLCAEEPVLVITLGELDCRIWDRCRSGAQVEYCLHDGGHVVPAQWVADGLDWMDRRLAQGGGLADRAPE